MNIYRWIKRGLVAALLWPTCMLLFAADASAAWETLRLSRADDRNCQQPYNRSYILARSDNRPLLVKPGARPQLEVYGHLLDVPGLAVRVEGAGISATRAGGHSGTVNAARRCGAIGSVKIDLVVADTVAANRAATLIIGGERIPIRTVRDGYQTAWSVFNNSAALSPLTQAQIEANRQAAQAQAQATLEANRPQCAVDIQACEQQRQTARQLTQAALAAAGPGGASIQLTLPQCSQVLESCRLPQTPRPNAASESAARCLRDLGGSVMVDNRGVLNVLLPQSARAAGGELDRCLQRGFIVEARTVNTPADLSRGVRGQGVTLPGPLPAPRHQQTRSTGTHPLLLNPNALPNQLTNEQLLKATWPAGGRQTLVGVDSGELVLQRLVGQTSDAARPLQWRIVTQPPNGVRSVSSLVFNRPRSSSTITATATLHRPVVAELRAAIDALRQLDVSSRLRPTAQLPRLGGATANPQGSSNARWEILPGTGPAPNICFRATSGSFSVALGQDRGTFDLVATEAANCQTARYTMRVWLDGTNPGLGAPYVAEVPLAPGSAIIRQR